MPVTCAVWRKNGGVRGMGSNFELDSTDAETGTRVPGATSLGWEIDGPFLLILAMGNWLYLPGASLAGKLAADSVHIQAGRP